MDGFVVSSVGIGNPLVSDERTSYYDVPVDVVDPTGESIAVRWICTHRTEHGLFAVISTGAPDSSIISADHRDGYLILNERTRLEKAIFRLIETTPSGLRFSAAGSDAPIESLNEAIRSLSPVWITPSGVKRFVLVSHFTLGFKDDIACVVQPEDADRLPHETEVSFFRYRQRPLGFIELIPIPLDAVYSGHFNSTSLLEKARSSFRETYLEDFNELWSPAVAPLRKAAVIFVDRSIAVRDVSSRHGEMVLVAWIQMGKRQFVLIAVDWRSGDRWIDDHFIAFEAVRHDDEWHFSRDALDQGILDQLQTRWEKFRRYPVMADPSEYSSVKTPVGAVEENSRFGVRVLVRTR